MTAVATPAVDLDALAAAATEADTAFQKARETLIDAALKFIGAQALALMPNATRARLEWVESPSWEFEVDGKWVDLYTLGEEEDDEERSDEYLNADDTIREATPWCIESAPYVLSGYGEEHPEVCRHTGMFEKATLDLHVMAGRKEQYQHTAPIAF